MILLVEADLWTSGGFVAEVRNHNNYNASFFFRWEIIENWGSKAGASISEHADAFAQSGQECFTFRINYLNMLILLLWISFLICNTYMQLELDFKLGKLRLLLSVEFGYFNQLENIELI